MYVQLLSRLLIDRAVNRPTLPPEQAQTLIIHLMQSETDVSMRAFDRNNRQANGLAETRLVRATGKSSSVVLLPRFLPYDVFRVTDLATTFMRLRLAIVMRFQSLKPNSGSLLKPQSSVKVTVQ